MASKTSPVTPAVVRWAVEQDGRELGDVADAVGVSSAELRQWMTGEVQPLVGQVTRLAELLQRPRVFFFLPEPPAAASLPSGFRHPPGGGSRTVSPGVLLEARRSKRLQTAVASIMDTDYRVRVPQATTEDSPSRVAAEARAWLGIEDDARWPDDATAAKAWRAALDLAGVLVFQLQLGKDEVRGFAAWDEKAPLVVVNISSVNPAARIFTMGHELGHLVLRQATACLEPTGGRLRIDTRAERWCEQFAAALIMPADEVSGLMGSRGVGLGKAGINEVSAMTRTFRASARAAAVRLADLGYAQPNLYAQVLAIFKPKPAAKQSGGGSAPRHVARQRQYGEHTVTTLLLGLPPRDALAVLRMKVDDVRRLAAEVPDVVAI